VPVSFGQGAEEFRAFAERLERLASGPIVDVAGQALDRKVPEIRAASAAGARETLPSRGGFGGVVAGTQLHVRRSRSSRGARMTVTALPGAVKDPAALNRGRAKHPTYGRRPWVIQIVPSGWFTKAMAKLSPQIVAEVAQAVRDTIRNGVRK
jgi:hypothetical protein